LQKFVVALFGGGLGWLVGHVAYAGLAHRNAMTYYRTVFMFGRGAALL
jgi:hypothetical protein